jgi:hypothetical protein
MSKKAGLTITKVAIAIVVFVIVFSYMFWLVKLFSNNVGDGQGVNKKQCESLNGACGIGRECVYTIAGNSENPYGAQTSLKLNGNCSTGQICCPVGTTAR